jgi:hypothetical protein
MYICQKFLVDPMKVLLMRGIFLAFFLFKVIVASATTYYVSPNGNDSNPGTFSRPWASWPRAFNGQEVSPGDTVYFRGGIYYKDDHAHTSSWYYPSYSPGAGYSVSRNGTSGNWIVFIAYPGEEPILDCGNVVPTGCSNRGLRDNSVQYVKFIGLTVRNVWQRRGATECGSKGVQCYAWEVSNRVEFIRCKAYNVHGIGFETYGGDMYYENCDAWNCADSLSNSGPGERGTGFASIVMGNTGSSIVLFIFLLNLVLAT